MTSRSTLPSAIRAELLQSCSLCKAMAGKKREKGRKLAQWCLAVSAVMWVATPREIKTVRTLCGVAAYIMPLDFWMTEEEINKSPPWNNWTARYWFCDFYWKSLLFVSWRVVIPSTWDDANHEAPGRFCKAACWHDLLEGQTSGISLSWHTFVLALDWPQSLDWQAD